MIISLFQINLLVLSRLNKKKNENNNMDLEIEDLNAKIFELKQQREKTSCLIKLINLRTAQKVSNSKETSSNLVILNEIKTQIDIRLSTFENERKFIKKIQKESNENRFQNNRNTCNKKQFNSTLKDYESSIKANLFGSNLFIQNIDFIKSFFIL